ncbi:hypothetical protein CDL12_27426 [Handroanthus impetiginosus]|uniref:Uncharacterized protein n=1 Tax=Handroanthus impetiginosus TaxID=429701 RepID=A0A2G9G433_9LAMI|nr:hypothetical protein CDL12_27426 [Handroanthus impetiginosus]
MRKCIRAGENQKKYLNGCIVGLMFNPTSQELCLLNPDNIIAAISGAKDEEIKELKKRIAESDYGENLSKVHILVEKKKAVRRKRIIKMVRMERKYEGEEKDQEDEMMNKERKDKEDEKKEKKNEENKEKENKIEKR